MPEQRGLQQCRVKPSSAGSISRGFTNCLFLQCKASSRDLLEEKPKSQLFPVDVGPWLQMTGAKGNTL